MNFIKTAEKVPPTLYQSLKWNKSSLSMTFLMIPCQQQHLPNFCSNWSSSIVPAVSLLRHQKIKPRSSSPTLRENKKWYSGRIKIGDSNSRGGFVQCSPGACKESGGKKECQIKWLNVFPDTDGYNFLLYARKPESYVFLLEVSALSNRQWKELASKFFGIPLNRNYSGIILSTVPRFLLLYYQKSDELEWMFLFYGDSHSRKRAKQRLQNRSWWWENDSYRLPGRRAATWSGFLEIPGISGLFHDKWSTHGVCF